MSTYESADDSLKRQAREIKAEYKAETEPHLLEETDLADLSGTTISRLMSTGALSHLTLGGRRHPQRPR
jgi:hypothetical protein